MTNEPLLPAEAVMLVEPRRSTAAACLQAALLTLAGRGHLTIVEEGRWLTRHLMQLQKGDGGALPTHLAEIKHALEAVSSDGPLKASEVVHALQKKFGNDYRHYVHDVIAPSLVGRGLIRHETRCFLGFIPYNHYERTAAGEAIAAPLVRLIDEAGGLKKLIRDDPDRAIAIARSAGVLLVLSPAARAQLPKIKKMLADRGDDGGTSALYVTGVDDRPDELEQWEIGADVGLGVLGEMSGWIDSIGAIGDFTGDDGGSSSDGGDGGGGGD